MELLSIQSGSNGNSTFVSSGNTSFLVDAGISKTKIEKGLSENGYSLKDVDGIFITHEHIDHISGLGVISRKYSIPIYATAGTIEGIKERKQLGEIDDSLFVPIETDRDFTIKDIEIRPRKVWHDANEPCCYSFINGDKKVSIATDFGDYNEYLIEAFAGSDALLLEANHDIRMLEVGPYPYELKRRILGKYGHLSNEASGKLLLRLLNDHIKGIILGHLSKENNFPELAMETVLSEICNNPYTSDLRDFNISVAKRDEVGRLITV